MYHIDGNMYVGEFKKGKKSGIGKQNYPNGNVFEGHFKKNLPNGEGELLYKDTNIIEKGIFKSGILEKAL